jgi:hypothetical protein
MLYELEQQSKTFVEEKYRRPSSPLGGLDIYKPQMCDFPAMN